MVARGRWGGRTQTPGISPTSSSSMVTPSRVATGRKMLRQRSSRNFSSERRRGVGNVSEKVSRVFRISRTLSCTVLSTTDSGPRQG